MSVHTVNTVQVTANHMREDQVRAEVAARYGRTEISDEAAVTIASWWASPGTVGSQLAAFSTGARVDAGRILDDLALTRRNEQWLTDDDHRALDALAGFVIAQVNRAQ